MRKTVILALLGVHILGSVGLAGAASLAWDYPVAEEAHITGYIVQQKVSPATTYSELARVGKSDRTLPLAPLSPSVRTCWRVMAYLLTDDVVTMSLPSNTACFTLLPRATKVRRLP